MGPEIFRGTYGTRYFEIVCARERWHFNLIRARAQHRARGTRFTRREFNSGTPIVSQFPSDTAVTASSRFLAEHL